MRRINLAHSPHRKPGDRSNMSVARVRIPPRRRLAGVILLSLKMSRCGGVVSFVLRSRWQWAFLLGLTVSQAACTLVGYGDAQQLSGADASDSAPRVIDEPEQDGDDIDPTTHRDASVLRDGSIPSVSVRLPDGGTLIIDPSDPRFPWYWPWPIPEIPSIPTIPWVPWIPSIPGGGSDAGGSMEVADAGVVVSPSDAGRDGGDGSRNDGGSNDAGANDGGSNDASIKDASSGDAGSLGPDAGDAAPDAATDAAADGGGTHREDAAVDAGSPPSAPGQLATP